MFEILPCELNENITKYTIISNKQILLFKRRVTKNKKHLDIIFRNVCLTGNIEMAKYVYKTFFVTKNDIIIMSYGNFLTAELCKNGQLHMIKWLHGLCQFTKDVLLFDKKTNISKCMFWWEY